jgi:starvation-inducible outer membrane lipoprotein
MPFAAILNAKLLRALFVVTVLSLAACVSSPQAEATRAQQMTEMSDAVTQLRQQTADLQGAIDSLKLVLAKQDTTNARLANVTGIVVVK